MLGVSYGCGVCLIPMGKGWLVVLGLDIRQFGHQMYELIILLLRINHIYLHPYHTTTPYATLSTIINPYLVISLERLLYFISAMGRKQRDMTCLKPFCFYCQKSFKNEVILHHHQKAKHFSCPKCPKKFSSIDSMLQHAKSQHNQNIQKVPSATAGRDSVALKIFGMQGVPRIEIESWISKNVNRYWGRIIEAQNKEHRKIIAELAKNSLAQNKKELMLVEEKEVDLQEQFPLQISFK